MGNSKLLFGAENIQSRAIVTARRFSLSFARRHYRARSPGGVMLIAFTTTTTPTACQCRSSLGEIPLELMDLSLQDVGGRVGGVVHTGKPVLQKKGVSPSWCHGGDSIHDLSVSRPQRNPPGCRGWGRVGGVVHTGRGVLQEGGSLWFHLLSDMVVIAFITSLTTFQYLCHREPLPPPPPLPHRN